MDRLLFTLNLHHLTADASQARVDLPDVELPSVEAGRLRGMLDALGKLAPRVEYPVAPEIRIATGNERFLVQVKEGQVRLSSWSLRTGGNNLTPQQIFAAITGAEETEIGDSTPATGGIRKRHLKIVGLIVAILGSNAITAWTLTRPPADFLPKYRLLAEEPGKRLLADVAGSYATGAEDGDYTLNIAPDGAVRWATLGEKGVVSEETRLTARPAESKGKPVLITSNRGVIEVRDNITLSFYRDIYHRKLP